MTLKTLLTVACATAGLAAMTAAPAAAQVIGIGTTQGGANAAIGAAISQVVSNDADFQMRPQKMGGTQQYLAVVNGGDLEFGLSNIMQYDMAVHGTGLSEGHPHEDLRLVASLMTFRNGVVTGRESGIDTLEDLEGRKVPTGYQASPLFDHFMEAFLASAGLSWDDVDPVPVVNLPKSWDAFKQGLTDVTIIAAGAGPLKEMNATVPGGVTFIPVIDNEELLSRLPGTRNEMVEPSPSSVALREPTMLNAYEYILFAHKDVPDDVVYQVAKAIYDNEEALQASSPLWNSYSPANIGRDYGLAYHPGAVKLFEEQGVN